MLSFNGQGKFWWCYQLGWNAIKCGVQSWSLPSANSKCCGVIRGGMSAKKSLRYTFSQCLCMDESLLLSVHVDAGSLAVLRVFSRAGKQVCISSLPSHAIRRRNLEKSLKSILFINTHDALIITRLWSVYSQLSLLAPLLRVIKRAERNEKGWGWFFQTRRIPDRNQVWKSRPLAPQINKFECGGVICFCVEKINSCGGDAKNNECVQLLRGVLVWMGRNHAPNRIRWPRSQNPEDAFWFSSSAKIAESTLAYQENVSHKFLVSGKGTNFYNLLYWFCVFWTWKPLI